ncbi:isocitrate/isopropylmalate family dehydrogenase [Bradyrhizobium sp. LTSP857]|uniref:isocitrate/isopropylmalate dehydrogenase family protein n=1 Tax=Bradyrhizobium sp. LTSP857 TaxID=1619231 RepID=UPI0005D184DF|nr:isocitrate/isopropylmalate family dehydrogenase [Bradyrhizobium sp. LTSP857]
MRILVLPGDGIGPEITAATIQVLTAASGRFNLGLELIEDVVGHDSLRRYGTTVRPEILDQARTVQGIILGPTATFDFKDEAKGEINPSKFFRKSLDLFANIRPSKTYEGFPGPVGKFDLVVVRENTEGFYADRNMELGNGEILMTPDVAVSLRRITRQCCERIARAGFELAMRRRRHVTLVHKANVLKIADGMLFLDECRKVAAEFPEVVVDDVLVDAMMAHVVRAPQRFDVIVTTNMFGDILSDLTAELSGSLGLGGSLNAGADYAMAQAAHGSAPDIAGKNVANPYSLILSAALLLAWYGRRTGKPAFEAAAEAIEAAAEAAVAARDVTRDIGGNLGTAEAGQALAEALKEHEGPDRQRQRV